MEEECLSEFDRTHHPALQRTAPGVTLDKENERQAANSRQGQIRSAEPAFIEPMQCKPVTALAAGEKWTFEIKFDGYRCIAVHKPARGKGLPVGRIINRRENGAMPLGHTEAGLPDRIR
jgi:hypothetical protein